VNRLGHEEVEALVVAAVRRTMPKAQTMTTTKLVRDLQAIINENDLDVDP
jgi:hypothetical protein